MNIIDILKEKALEIFASDDQVKKIDFEPFDIKTDFEKKALEILELTNQGAALKLEDLETVEAVRNGLEIKEKAYFNSIYIDVKTGYYKERQWWHGFDNLLLDHLGHVYWRKIYIYFFNRIDGEISQKMAEMLAYRCRSLELENIPVNIDELTWRWDLRHGAKIIIF